MENNLIIVNSELWSHIHAYTVTIIKTWHYHENTESKIYYANIDSANKHYIDVCKEFKALNYELLNEENDNINLYYKSHFKYKDGAYCMDDPYDIVVILEKVNIKIYK